MRRTLEGGKRFPEGENSFKYMAGNVYEVGCKVDARCIGVENLRRWIGKSKVNIHSRMGEGE